MRSPPSASALPRLLPIALAALSALPSSGCFKAEMSWSGLATGPLATPSPSASLAPTFGAIAFDIAGGEAYATAVGVTLDLAAPGYAEMYVTNVAGCASGGAWETIAVSKPWTLGQTESLATVYAKFRLGLYESACVSDTITHDSVAPGASAFAVGNTSPTPLRSFALTVASVTDSPTHWCIREDAAVASCAWTAMPVPASYSVSAGDGPKALTLWLVDAAGNVSPGISAAPVTLDMTAPPAPSSLALSSPAVSPADDDTPSILIGGVTSGDVIELHSNATCSSLKASGAAASSTITLTSSTVAAGAHQFYARAIDVAGNASPCSSTPLAYTHSPAPPAPVMGAVPSSTVTLRPTWTWSSGGGTGSGGFRFKLDDPDLATGAASTAAQAFTPANQLSYGAHVLYVQERNAEGVWSPSGSRAITLVTPSVAAALPAAPDWNDYVRASNAAVACDGTEAGDYRACVHGGELRKVVMTGVGSCAGIVFQDGLGLFDWTCSAASGTAVFEGKLKPGKGLRDLVDATAWKSNWVAYSGAVEGSGAATAWWGNPVVPLPDNSAAGPLVLDGVDNDAGGADQAYAAGTIFTLATGRATAGYNLGLDKLAVVTLPGAALAFNGAASDNFNSATGESSAPDKRAVIAAGNQRFLWVEAKISAYVSGNHATHGIAFSGGSGTGIRFSRIHASAVSAAAEAAILMYRSPRNLVSHSTLEGGAQNGIWFKDGSDSNIVEATTVSGFAGYGIGGVGTTTALCPKKLTLRGVGVQNCGIAGISIDPGCDYAKLVRISAHNNSGGGTLPRSAIDIGGDYAVLSEISVSNNNMDGMLLYGKYGRVAGLTSTGNGLTGLWLNGSTGVQVAGATLANNRDGGMLAESGSVNSVVHRGVAAASMSGTYAGFDFTTASNSPTFSDIASFHQGTAGGVSLLNIDNGRFTGGLVLGSNSGNCVVSGGSSPGLTGSCAISGASDATVVISSDLSSAFLGAQAADDPVNPSDSSGSAPYASLAGSDGFLYLANLFRGWGKPDAGFHSSSSNGRCVSGTCHIWDWRLRATDTILRGGTAFTAGSACPADSNGNVVFHSASLPKDALNPATTNAYDVTGDMDGICEAGESCRQTYLQSAIEIMDDDAGDDDGLCESNERCLYAPNLGSYQGEGAPASCVFSSGGGPVTGVQLYGYPINGQP